LYAAAVVFVVDAFAAENAVTNGVLYSSDVGTVVATDDQVGELTEAVSGRPHCEIFIIRKHNLIAVTRHACGRVRTCGAHAANGRPVGVSMAPVPRVFSACRESARSRPNTCFRTTVASRTIGAPPCIFKCEDVESMRSATA
jgi:hypothetical protein